MEIQQHWLFVGRSHFGMKDTGQDNPRPININRAYGHTIVDGEHRNAENDKLADLLHAPGELYSTFGDLNIWCNALWKGRYYGGIIEYDVHPVRLRRF